LEYADFEEMISKDQYDGRVVIFGIKASMKISRKSACLILLRKTKLLGNLLNLEQI
jgi:hypothetical protein